MDLILAIGKPFIPQWDQLRPFIADLWIIATIVAVLLTPFFTRRSNYACAAVALFGLAMALVSLLIVVLGGDDIIGTHFVGLLVIDHFAILWKAMLLLFVMGIIVMWFSTTSATMHEGDGPEFFTLLLGATLGMSLMASTSNLLMIFMAVELASLPSYVLAGFRKTDKIGAEASLKYVLFGAATSAVMVYGLSMLYGLYGTLHVGDVVIDGQVVQGLASQMGATTGGAALLVIAILGLIAGIGFKISAVPFHFWCPDVFEGASIDVSAFLSVASKGAALALLLRVLMLIANGAGFHNSGHVSLTAIAVIIGTIGAVTATVGNTAAFVQTNIKRLLAYSSIAHAGYMLCALSLLIQHNNGPDALAVSQSAPQSILLYLGVYLFMNLGAFTVAGVIYMQTGSEKIADYAGLGRRAPLLAACMLCFMFSLVGLPPFAGFIAKFNVMYVLIENGGWWWALVGVIGVNTILSLFYYARVIRVMYLTPSEEPELGTNIMGTAIAVMCAIMLVAMLVGYGPLKELTTAYGNLYGVSSMPQSLAADPHSGASPALIPESVSAVVDP